MESGLESESGRIKTLHAVVSGRVQGVFFRAWTRDKARSLQLSGWVRNLPDKRVEVLAQGEASALNKLLAKLHQGPPLARVDQVESEFRDNQAMRNGFFVTA